MKIFLIVLVLSIGIYNLIYKNLFKDYKTLDLTNKNWEEE